MNGFGKRLVPLAVVLAVFAAVGCHSSNAFRQPFEPPAVPKELSKANLPDYRVEPPDILLIEAVRAIPKPPYKAEPLDVLYVNLDSPRRDPTLTGQISVEP